MAGLASFDIVSDFDFQEMRNAVDQATRDIHTRYDLKDTKTEVTLAEQTITLNSASEYSLQAVRDIIESKLIRRGLSLKILEYGDEIPASGGRVRQVVTLKRGIPEDLAKQLTKRIRDEFKKVTPQIQGDAIRVQGKNRDDLQNVIQLLKDENLPVALQFTNYR